MHPAAGRLTLRTRLLMVGVLGLAVSLGIGAVALYVVLRYSGLHSLDRDAHASADQVVQLVQAGHLPDPIPVTGDQIVQVVDRRDRVVSASVNGDLLTALLRPSEQARAERSPIQVPGSRMGQAGRLRVIAQAVPGTDRTVVVAQGLDEVQRSLRLLRNAALVIFPLLLVALGLIAARAIGAALRPVEQLRVGAERISGSGRQERLPVPRSADEIRALALTLNSMLDRLAQSRERQRSFVADVAHELRSPLTSIRTQLEVAQRMGELSSADGSLVDDLHVDVLRMGALVEDLLTLARLDADAAPMSPPQPVPVAPILAEVAARHRGSSASVRVEGCPTDLEVAATPEELTRVVGNLVDNAVRHADRRVLLSAGSSGQRVVLRVDDDGPGIAEQDRGRVLERFTRLDESRDRDAGGSGLGLAIVHELVVRRGGAVRLVSSPLGGLRAEVDLPRPS
ncbi:sensor histidine kinase [Nocardioides terrisoli]|uniref:sensor histidine kinase n=1 Tax=Nocardioides terrisoli TaxID=3388267 RepID=UPI00287BC4D9|nr:HAMP domain-containing sensor histidine kinase [Nocardioides marmorisolisilvae]